MKTFLCAFLAFSAACFAAPKPADDNAALESKIEKIWQDSSKVYRSPKSGLFYTVEIGRVPPPEDMKKLLPLKKTGVPNWHGGHSGTEDCSMLCGIMLAGLCDKYAVVGGAETAARARGLYKALLLTATAHGERGFVARGVSPDDCKTVYPGTSRDQYTHYIHGMWRYYNSGIATADEKAQIARIFSDIADKMEREVKPDAEPPYSFKFYKGMPDDRGVGKMLEVYPHEAARLSMFYAAAYSATKKRKYFDLYRKHIEYAIEHSAEISSVPERKLRWLVPAYAVLQMEASLELLHEVEKDASLKKRIAGVMDLVAEFFDKCPVFDIEKRKSSRDCAEIINGKLMAPSYKLSQTDEKILRSRIANLNGARDCGGSYTLLSAYWKARAKGYLKP